MNLLRTLNEERDLTIVLVTHDSGVGEQCHRIVRMQDGSIVGEEFPSGPASEIAHMTLDGRRDSVVTTA